MTQTGLQVLNLQKRYRQRQVVRDVSLSVAPGEVVGLLGPNGAGKTTCFYMICGLIKPNGGKVLLDGEDITALPMYRRARRGIGYLPQEASVFRGLTVEQNIMAALEIIEKEDEKRHARLEKLLEEFGLAHVRHTKAQALSGGERRRTEIARCLAVNPRYVLLDEPLAGIDPIAVQDIRKLILDLSRRGIGVLITDHNVRDTLTIVQHAYIVHEGSVLASGTPIEIIDNADVRRVYLGNSFA